MEDGSTSKYLRTEVPKYLSIYLGTCSPVHGCTSRAVHPPGMLTGSPFGYRWSFQGSMFQPSRGGALDQQPQRSPSCQHFKVSNVHGYLKVLSGHILGYLDQLLYLEAYILACTISLSQYLERTLVAVYTVLRSVTEPERPPAGRVTVLLG